MPNDLDDWFITEVLPLEGTLMRYLRHNWRDSAEWADLRQEVYARVYEAARAGLPERAAPFVMTTARNLLIDRARRSQVVSIEAYAELSDLALDELTPDRHAGGRADLQRFVAALDDLPPRCREVVMLRKVDGLSQREVAEKMGIAEDTVEKQIAKGMRALADALFAHGIGAGIRKLEDRLRKRGT
ncbi:RNA polymerase sigma-70 factor (ECF subfamily) [Pseudoduganella lurida]|uniref:RNA polymerase sigma-70 factor (ECF subfamily) n=1 Tax=Pseudoduganella lurida TaxID=1036180 RepID=A0A562RM11_9BURK|nr:RNA polymerase sigma factor [Pseudoduganella lurida]TWI69490.1 RNA polymerase sigma-70 factor (ECF subfamily) [Pseudoduganella lurida]